MEILYIVLYRQNEKSRWKSISEGELPTRQLALNLIECKQAAGWQDWEFAIVGGPIETPEEMETASAALGAF